MNCDHESPVRAHVSNTHLLDVHIPGQLFVAVVQVMHCETEMNAKIVWQMGDVFWLEIRRQKSK